MDLTEHQLKIVRDALNLHVSIHRDKSGRKLTWEKFALDISIFWENEGRAELDENGEPINVIKTEAL